MTSHGIDEWDFLQALSMHYTLLLMAKKAWVWAGFSTTMAQKTTFYAPKRNIFHWVTHKMLLACL